MGVVCKKANGLSTPLTAPLTAPNEEGAARVAPLTEAVGGTAAWTGTRTGARMDAAEGGLNKYSMARFALPKDACSAVTTCVRSNPISISCATVASEGVMVGSSTSMLELEGVGAAVTTDTGGFGATTGTTAAAGGGTIAAGADAFYKSRG